MNPIRYSCIGSHRGSQRFYPVHQSNAGGPDVRRYSSIVIRQLLNPEPVSSAGHADSRFAGKRTATMCNQKMTNDEQVTRLPGK